MVKEIHPAISPFSPSSGPAILRRVVRGVRLQVLILALALAAFLAPSPAPAAAATPLRVAAPFDCGHNTFCALGLRRYYGIDIAPQLRPMAAGATLQALQQGRAGVAVVFSTDPSLANPDIVELQDDRGMFGTESLFPLATGARHRRLRRAAADAHQDDRQAALDGRAAAHERRGGERHAAARRRGRLRAPGPPRRLARPASGPAHRGRRAGLRREPPGRPGLRAGAAGGGFNASVADVGGFRDRAYDALYRNRVQLLVDYGSSASTTSPASRASPATTRAAWARC